MPNKVSLVQVEDFDEEGIKNAVYDAIDLVDFTPKKNIESVLIKPNLCYYWDYSTGETTDPRIVSSIIDYLRDKISQDLKIRIIESDASAMKVNHAYKMLGYEDMTEAKSLELINLSDSDYVSKEIEIKGHRIRLPFSTIFEDSDLFINVPKLKIGPYAGGKALPITCALKNLFGCLSETRKVRYHNNLEEVIVAINKLLKPDLTVVDGIFAKGRVPCRLGLVMAGKENLAVDYVASKIMGYDPSKIGYLKLAVKEKAGSINNLDIVGEDLEKFYSKFPRQNNFKFKWMWRLQLLLLKTYSRLVSDILPPYLC